MAVRKLKPTSAGRRFQTVSDFEEITRTRPEKSLTEGLNKKAGRNNLGRVTSRRRGGGVKRLYRIIDFKRDKTGVEATVAHIEYDPNRTARIALLHYSDGEKRYILAPVGLKQGDKIMSGINDRNGVVADIKPGNALQMARIPWVLLCIMSSCTPARAGRCAVPPVPTPSWSPKRATTPCCVCPRAKCARCLPPAWLLWVRWAMCTTKPSLWAKLAAIVGWVVVPRFAALP